MIVKKKMRVYLLFFNKGEFAGVFSSIPKAHDFAEKWNKVAGDSVELMYLLERRLNLIDTMRSWAKVKKDGEWTEWTETTKRSVKENLK